MERTPSQEENKLLLLYIFAKIGDMTAPQLTRFCLEYSLMEYLDLQLLLAELTESGLLRLRRSDIAMYALTPEGQHSLSLFQPRIPHSRRAFVDEKAAIWRETFREEQQIRTEIWPDVGGSGGAVAEMLVVEGESLLFSVRLQMPTVKDARRVCARFRERSGDVYRALLGELYKDDMG